MKLIIDTDPGVDDTIAIACAAALKEVELIGLTTIFGNTFVEQSSRNARYLVDMLGLDCPVHEGAALPYGASGYTPSANVHGPEGFGQITDVPQIGANGAASAAEFLVDSARRHKGALVVCAIGPLTNIADAIALDPEFCTNLGQLVIMGGAVYCPGNITPHAEANIYHDALAADAVFAAPLETTLIGLDVTRQTLMTMPQIKDVARHAPGIGGFIAQITPFYLDFYRQVEGIDGCPMHDAAAVLACVAPQMFGFAQTGLRVKTAGAALGQTVPDTSRPPVKVATRIEAARAVTHVMEHLASIG